MVKKEASGVPVVIFRGVTQKGEVKLMIDGVSINNSYRGSIYYYLDFPIEMVERIEVIRGASSVLYGSGAISGVINIITKSTNKSTANSVFISAGSNSYYKGGALVSTDVSGIKITLDAYYQKNDKEVDVTTNQPSQSSDRHLKDYSAGVNISNENISLLARIKKSDIGNAYGLLGVVDTEAGKYANINNSLLTQLTYKDKISKNNSLKVLAGYNRYSQTADDIHPSLGHLNAQYEEDSYFSELNLHSTTIKNNELLMGLKYESAKTLSSDWSTASGARTPISDPTLSRNISSVYLNDLYSVTTDIDISAGLRYDNYSDFGDAYSPNLGLVYRVNEKTRVKALYSHAFRAPSWVELTSNSNLDTEKSKSFESGVIFKQNLQNVFRINIYSININDMITKDPATKKYIQTSKNIFIGSELEYIYAPNNQTEINFLASYIDAKDDDGNDLADVANILSTASFTYKLDMGITFGSLMKYVSSSKRSSTDTRADMEDSFIFDQTISYDYKEFTATLIVKDLFNQNTYYSLPQTNPDDFDDGGRTIMINASKKF